jgi:hypothetical protein
VLVRRRIQTPSDAKVLSVVQPEGEVVLGASPPARPHLAAEDPLRPGGRTVGSPVRLAPHHDDFRRGSRL